MEHGLGVRGPLRGMELGPQLGRAGVPNQPDDNSRLQLNQRRTCEVQVGGSLFEVDTEAGREVVRFKAHDGDRPKGL